MDWRIAATLLRTTNFETVHFEAILNFHSCKNNFITKWFCKTLTNIHQKYWMIISRLLADSDPGFTVFYFRNLSMRNRRPVAQVCYDAILVRKICILHASARILIVAIVGWSLIDAFLFVLSLIFYWLHQMVTD